jgi:OOP family OmpA-OmpF porin
MNKYLVLLATLLLTSSCYTTSTGQKKFCLCGKEQAVAAAPVAAPTVAKAMPAVVGDSDHDGINDNADKCPNSPAGSAVDSMGCAMQNNARGALKGVVFKTASPELTPSSMKILDEVATTLSEFPSVNVEVQGHTDNTGNSQMNHSLSQARAETVMNYLAAKGVAKQRLSAKGYGQDKPTANNTTKEGRQLNRRVELQWLE